LQAYDDPRLPFYATLWQGNILATQARDLPTATDPAKQKGLPNGYDINNIGTAIPGWQDSQLVDYSEPNTGTIASLSAPTMLQSYAEVEFLLAEAALRGWGPGTAADHYAKAVTASMQSTTMFPGSIVIKDDVIADYLTNNAPYNSGGSFDEQMETIYTQFYLAHFMWYDNFEAFSTYRRVGYPKLTPPNYPANFTNGAFLRRLRYPVSEATLNTKNYNEAVANQGEDNYLTRVWWDKEL
jgi:hypothetical protein